MIRLPADKHSNVIATLEDFRVSKNFAAHEFRCKGADCCGGVIVIDPILVDALQEFREKLGVAVMLSSGYRCVTHNREVHGQPDSQHLYGRAGDVRKPHGMTIDFVAGVAESVTAFRKGAILKYPWGLHLDVRPHGPLRLDFRG